MGKKVLQGYRQRDAQVHGPGRWICAADQCEGGCEVKSDIARAQRGCVVYKHDSTLTSQDSFWG
ncbi:hypothetical protein CsSME_00043146 [Camellia sinensis var. sinensis]